jgi:hypothetical protein
VLRRNNIVSRLNEGLGELTVLEILLDAQDREIEAATSIRVISWPATAAPAA